MFTDELEAELEAGAKVWNREVHESDELNELKKQLNEKSKESTQSQVTSSSHHFLYYAQAFCLSSNIFIINHLVHTQALAEQLKQELETIKQVNLSTTESLNRELDEVKTHLVTKTKEGANLQVIFLSYCATSYKAWTLSI